MTFGQTENAPSPGIIRAIGMALLGFSFPVLALVWSLSMNRRSLAFAFFLNWALMAIAFVVWLIAPIRFGRGYYRVHAFERHGRLYEGLGVRFFQRFLRQSKFHGPKPFPRYVSGPGAGATLAEDTVGPETAHLLIFLVVAGVAVDAAWRGWWDTAAWLMGFNIPCNAYPVFSMRAVRARVARLRRGRA